MRYRFEMWRFFTPLFLHGNLMHLVSNIMTQLMIGSSLEADIGGLKFFFMYMCSG
jgi:rhomboid protease GluP